MPSNYNFTESGKVVPFDDAFIRVEQFGSSLFAWGQNSSGQLADNTNILRQTPRQEITSNTNWKQIAGGQSHTAAIKTDGTLWCWGFNSTGQLGDNTITARSTPRQEITSSTNWKQVAGGVSHTAAIKTDGTLWCWGINSSGQLGDNTLVSRSTPRQEITSSTNWKQVSGGQSHTAAIKTDGTLWCWGFNAYGQIGDNTFGATSRSTPRQEITSSTNWKQVSGGFYHTAAIKTDGTLWVWGQNATGQIGDNTNASRSTPRQEITSSTNWKQVAGGFFHTAAIKTDGTLWCWGRNADPAIGDNTNASRSTPRQEITSSTNWKQVSAGGYHTTAIKTNGTLWSWGFNNVGQLGDNTLVPRSTPRQEITSSTNWKQVSGGSIHTVAIQANDYPILY
jgi:alpha-tubulin suppressor-like RCC1 family protein